MFILQTVNLKTHLCLSLKALFILLPINSYNPAFNKAHLSLLNPKLVNTAQAVTPALLPAVRWGNAQEQSVLSVFNEAVMLYTDSCSTKKGALFEKICENWLGFILAKRRIPFQLVDETRSGEHKADFSFTLTRGGKAIKGIAECKYRAGSYESFNKLTEKLRLDMKREPGSRVTTHKGEEPYNAGILLTNHGRINVPKANEEFTYYRSNEINKMLEALLDKTNTKKHILILDSTDLETFLQSKEVFSPEKIKTTIQEIEDTMRREEGTNYKPFFPQNEGLNVFSVSLGTGSNARLGMKLFALLEALFPLG